LKFRFGHVEGRHLLATIRIEIAGDRISRGPEQFPKRHAGDERCG
jgi:hypothetical protein